VEVRALLLQLIGDFIVGREVLERIWVGTFLIERLHLGGCSLFLCNALSTFIEQPYLKAFREHSGGFFGYGCIIVTSLHSLTDLPDGHRLRLPPVLSQTSIQKLHKVSDIGLIGDGWY